MASEQTAGQRALVGALENLNSALAILQNEASTTGKDVDKERAALEARKELLLSDIQNLHASKRALEGKVARLQSNAAYLLGASSSILGPTTNLSARTERTIDRFPEIKVGEREPTGTSINEPPSATRSPIKRDRRVGEQTVGSTRMRRISSSEIETFIDRESWSNALPASSAQQRDVVPQNPLGSPSQNESQPSSRGSVTFSLQPVSSLSQSSASTPKQRIPGKYNPSSSVSHRNYPSHEMEKTVECRIYGHPDSDILLYDYFSRGNKAFKGRGPVASTLVRRDIESWERGLQLFEHGKRKAETLHREGVKLWSCPDDQQCLPRFCSRQASGRTPNPDGPYQKEACPSCVAANRLCFIRKMPATEDKIVMLPLPEKDRTNVANNTPGVLHDPYQLRYWVRDPEACRRRLGI